MPCFGNGDDHCCYVAGKACPFLEENTVPGRRWACGLRRELGDWDLVISDVRYKLNVAPHFGAMNCRDWPDGKGVNSAHCEQCGVTYRGD